MKTVAVLGSTGSIGKQTVELLASDRFKFLFKTVLLSSNTQVDLLVRQVHLLGSKYAAVLDYNKLSLLQQSLSYTCTQAIGGANAIRNALSEGVDIAIIACSGFSCIDLILEAVRYSKVVGIANKESIVCAWHIIRRLADECGTIVIPIDSEHNSIFRVVHNRKDINSITLTASGGPFRNYLRSQMEKVSLEDALCHPTWSMGKIISINSATLMNKALEAIEAKNLFAVDNIKILIHPESIVHCIVEFNDTFCAMGASIPDMMLHIAHVLTWPSTMPLNKPSMNLASVGALNFYEVDTSNFPAIRILSEVMKYMGNLPILMNASNEVAVDMFISRQIKFTQIVDIVEYVVESIKHEDVCELESIKYYDQLARERVERWKATARV